MSDSTKEMAERLVELADEANELVRQIQAAGLRVEMRVHYTPVMGNEDGFLLDVDVSKMVARTGV